MSQYCYRKSEPDCKVVKRDFTQELLQWGKRDLSIELGSISNIVKTAKDL